MAMLACQRAAIWMQKYSRIDKYFIKKAHVRKAGGQVRLDNKFTRKGWRPKASIKPGPREAQWVYFQWFYDRKNKVVWGKTEIPRIKFIEEMYIQVEILDIRAYRRLIYLPLADQRRPRDISSMPFMWKGSLEAWSMSYRNKTISGDT